MQKNKKLYSSLRNPNKIHNNNTNNNKIISFFQNFLSEKPFPERFTKDWWWEQFIIFIIFGITGSLTVFFVKPFLQKTLQLEGSLKEGPWSFRFAYILVMMPVYSIMLLTIGTFFGRYYYFKKFVIKMWSRFLPTFIIKK
jgi:hypothetical protein